MDLDTTDYEEELESVMSLDLEEIGKALCDAGDHVPTRVIADNGFTYDTICARCGEELD